MWVHVWHVMRVSWTILLHLVVSRVHSVETWPTLKLRRVEARGSSPKLRRTEVWRSVTELRRTEPRSVFKLWMVKARCWWSAPKLWMMETWIRSIKTRAKFMSVGKIHGVIRPIVHHESRRFVQKPSLSFHVVHHHHHSGGVRAKVAMGRRIPLSRGAHRETGSRTAKAALRGRRSGLGRRWGTHA